MERQQKGLRNTISPSLQETRFIDKLTVSETVRLFASFYNLPPERVSEVISIVSFDEKRSSYKQNLSGGQRQKLVLAIALLYNAQLMLLDEPTTELDPTARRERWNILMSLKQASNTSLILTTHYMEETGCLGDRKQPQGDNRIFNLKPFTGKPILQRWSYFVNMGRQYK